MAFRISGALAAATVVLIALAGCGGDDSTDDGSVPSTLTKNAYIDRVDAICQRLYVQRDPLEVEAAQAAQAGDNDRAAEVFENAADITANRFAEIKQLPKPAGDEADLAIVLKSADATVETAKAAAEAIRNDDTKALAQASGRGLRTTTRFNKAAIRYGFLVCGRGQSATIG